MTVSKPPARPIAALPVPAAGPTLADARAAIAGWTDLSKQKLGDLAASISGLARICELAEYEIVLSCENLNALLFRRAPAVWGFTAQRHGRICGNARFIMRRMDLHAPELPGAQGLSNAWQALYAALEGYRQTALISFIGYCSVSGIEPEAVLPDSLTAFEMWSHARTIYRDPADRARKSASNWNWASQHIAGWPAIELVRPGMRRQYTLPFTDYPATFQADVKGFADGLAAGDEDEIYDDDVLEEDAVRRQGGPLRPRTISGRLDQLRRAAAALVLQGTSIADIGSLRDLVTPPERPKAIRHFYRERHGHAPNSQVSGILECLRQVARYHCRLPKAEVARISKWAAAARPKWSLGMTEKNQERLRPLIQEIPRAMLLNFPEELVRRAEGNTTGSGKKKKLLGRASPIALTPLASARLVAIAVALEILLTFPMRRSNLASLRLDKHLQWLNPRQPVSHIFLSASEMKGREGLQWPLAAPTGDLIERYLRDYRPLLAAPGNRFLFPGPGLAGRSAHELAINLCNVVEQELGLKINAHLLRHFAAWVFLNRNPGAYETLRRVLGHKSLKVTIACYTGLEGDAAARRFDTSVLEDRAETRAVAQVAFNRQTSRKPKTRSRPRAIPKPKAGLKRKTGR